jgi:hypothetical protein
MTVFEEYCDKYSDKILSDLEIEIENLNLPKYVQSRLLDVLIECEGEIIEHYFEQIIGDFEDRAYDELKESRLNIN